MLLLWMRSKGGSTGENLWKECGQGYSRYIILYSLYMSQGGGYSQSGKGY